MHEKESCTFKPGVPSASEKLNHEQRIAYRGWRREGSRVTLELKMKMIWTLLACLVLVGCRSHSRPSGELRTERSSGTKGFLERTYRGDELVLLHHSNGVNRTQSRVYYFAGREAFAESDDDGDGFFETLTVFGDSMSEFDMYTRQPDGSVVPVSASVLTNQLQKVEEANERFMKFQKELNRMTKEGSIGIGPLPIEGPSHPTERTDRVHGESAVRGRKLPEKN